MDYEREYNRKTDRKRNRAACAFAERIIGESRETDVWYEYSDEFAKLLDHPKSLVRNRATLILAAEGFAIIKEVRKGD